MSRPVVAQPEIRPQIQPGIGRDFHFHRPGNHAACQCHGRRDDRRSRCRKVDEDHPVGQLREAGSFDRPLNAPFQAFASVDAVWLWRSRAYCGGSFQKEGFPVHVAVEVIAKAVDQCLEIGKDRLELGLTGR